MSEIHGSWFIDFVFLYSISDFAMAQDLSGLAFEQQQALLDGGALEPRANHLPNFENPANFNTLTRTVIGLAFGICLMSVLTRFFVSWENWNRINLADGILLFGLGTYVAYGAVVLDSTKQVGYLIHQWDVRLRDAIYLSRNFTIGSNLFRISSASVKAAILLEWLHIFNQTQERNSFFWTSHAVLWFNIISFTVACIIFSVACKPYAKNWDPFLHGTCYDTRPVYVASTAFYLLVDLFILALPQRIIWRLHMTKRKKQGVAAFFGVGVLAR
ncbi:hypothetical protein GGS20DRAFT_566817 [Poronia punctata]|nr:hypothetical protein GGS20DRAFT_566817 [Poronia punctata]